MEGTKKPGRQAVTPGERVVSVTVSVTVAQRQWLRAQRKPSETVRELVEAAMDYEEHVLYRKMIASAGFSRTT